MAEECGLHCNRPSLTTVERLRVVGPNIRTGFADTTSPASLPDDPSSDQAEIQDAILPNSARPGLVHEQHWQRPPGRGPRGRRYVYIWQCCACGKASIGIMVESCPDCGASRCPYCRTEKVRVQ
ncbi:hypothetical protein L207DRAFT_148231 [Hyaloscypha variabilis F]|uniref:Uncharacterized protein n=1 Tax=Hyaloscypha variabilis (strain UAMH 11265 / GT02V1 / F) TaxID=1149755 RepID=A0A2J6R5Y9_HYAVF|nr:hypothetical protein L207DRAFT_148231 [Hyaloscypha variabilis F]